MGNRTWVEADPTEARVIRLRAPSDNTWLNQDAVVVRWKALEEPSL